MDKVIIDFKVPDGWMSLSDRQLRYVFSLFAAEFSADEIKVLCLLRWSGAKVIGRQDSGAYLLKKGKDIFEVSPQTLAALLPHLHWLGVLPVFPVRLSHIHRRKALPADFAGVPFETFIICDNLYQGYLSTQNDELLDELGGVLYGKKMKFLPEERISFFYWFAALKDMFSHRFSDFFQPMEAAGGNLLGSQAMSVEEAMNAQIRALTKGDVTKEIEVLALDSLRALTELNAQAKEYRELNAKLK